MIKPNKKDIRYLNRTKNTASLCRQHVAGPCYHCHDMITVSKVS